MSRGTPQRSAPPFYMKNQIKRIIASLLLLFCICNFIPSVFAASVTVPFSLSGVNRGSYDKIITDTVTANGTQLTISKTYLKIVAPGDDVTLENNTGITINKGYYFLTRQASNSEKWLKSATTKKISSFPTVCKVTAKSLREHGFSQQSISNENATYYFIAFNPALFSDDYTNADSFGILIQVGSSSGNTLTAEQKKRSRICLPT